MGLATGCAMKDDAAGADDLYMDDDVPSGNCMGETGPCDTDTEAGGDESSTPTGGACESTSQCSVGDTCMATFDGDIGEFECQSACIPDDDETRWCIDDDGCCNEGSVCAERGYCRPSGAADTTAGDSTSSTDGSSETGTDGTTDTGNAASTSDGGSTGTGG